jgi:hypothetical protein
MFCLSFVIFVFFVVRYHMSEYKFNFPDKRLWIFVFDSSSELFKLLLLFFKSADI